MDPTRNQFISDAKDIVDRLYADLQQLRSLRAQGRHRRELASRIFRHVHTLKGSAGSIGLQFVSQLAHEFESVLDGVRLGRVTIDDAVLNLFEDTADALTDALANSGRRDEALGLMVRIRPGVDATPRLASIELNGEVTRVRSNFINGIKKFPVRVETN